MARQVLPGTTYLVTRRCADRQFLLKPSEQTNAIFGYLLAVAAQRCGISIHAVCVMSNHVHLVLTDPSARLPEFERDLNGMVARAINKALGRSGRFWDEKRVSAIPLPTPEDLVSKASYAVANPVAAGLVPRAAEWPGLVTDPARIGGAPLVIERPEVFSRKSTMPPRASLVLTPPPGFSAGEFRERVVAGVAAREQDATVAMKARGVGFLGRRRVLQQKPTARAASTELQGGFTPQIAGMERAQRREAIAQRREFAARYLEARQKFREGIRDVVFPAGTYLMRVLYGVNCAAPA